MFDSFHFLRPLMLLLIPVLIALIWLWMRIKLANSQWQSILPSHLHQRLVTSKGDGQNRHPFIWLMIVMTISCIGMAGPAWEKLPQPVYQTNSGRVVVMDMSLSMRATDVSPSRLARAKFKAIDLIKEINDGEVGLVAYAGEAFTISPLTEDISNLENLIPSLSPEIMPGSGSNPVAGFVQAKLLLDNAGYQHGHIYWITDGIELQDIAPLRSLILDTQYEISALTIGTDEGAPIKLLDGSMVKDSSGAIVIPRMNRDYLEQALVPSNARFTGMTIDDSDIRSMLLTSNRLDQVRQGNDEQSTGDAWRDMGGYLAWLILPIALFMFRRGLLFSIIFIVLIPMHSPSSFAQATQHTPTLPAGSNAVKNASITEDLKSLFLNRNQQGQRAFEAKEFQTAGELFNDINWQAAAAYKAGDYESAAALYQQSDGLDSIYNHGNALAKMGELQNALDAYNKVLQLAPEHERAARNKAIVEDLLEQQENQQEQQEQQQKQESDQSDEQNGEDDQQEQSQDGSQSDQSNQQNSEQSESSEQQDQQNESENQDQQGESDNSEQSPDEEQQNEQSEQLGSDTQDENSGEQQQEQDLQNIQAIDQSELTPEEREQMQRLQTLMNKVPDDPAFLLQRKMLIESQRRKQYAPPTTKEQEW